MHGNDQTLPPNAVQGLNLFNTQAFYESHEYFEAAWREAPVDERELYRALLQISGGYFRLSQGNLPGAEKFFSHAAGWLAEFPGTCRGLNIDLIRHNLAKILADLQHPLPPDKIMQRNFHPILSHPQENA